MREIVLDTETTGLDPASGDRIVEIGCVELVNHLASGELFHCYINPERDIPEGAFRVHGLSKQFLSDKPVFADIGEAFLEFIGEDKLVIHNASFDLGFLNSELERIGLPILRLARTIDTLALARHKFPGAPASLDSLCRRFEIDNTERDLHGALLDAQLLAEVYLELLGGRQPDLVLPGNQTRVVDREAERHNAREPRPHAPTSEELAAHTAFVATLNDTIWKN